MRMKLSCKLTILTLLAVTVMGLGTIIPSKTWAANSCPPCTESKETTTENCACGQAGIITKERTANTGGVCGVYGVWTEKSNTCAAVTTGALPLKVTWASTGQDGNCPAGQIFGGITDGAADTRHSLSEAGSDETLIRQKLCFDAPSEIGLQVAWKPGNNEAACTSIGWVAAGIYDDGDDNHSTLEQGNCEGGCKQLSLCMKANPGYTVTITRRDNECAAGEEPVINAGDGDPMLESSKADDTSVYCMKISGPEICPADPTVDGKCGAANSATPVSTAPTANLCLKGAASAVKSNADNFTWTCDGTGTPVGEPDECKVPKVVNSVCGTADKTTRSTKPTALAALCAKGDPTAVSDGSDGTFAWTCNGTGTPANCSATKPVTTINGECGAANSIVPVSIAPTANLCRKGIASEVTSNTSNFTWTCDGTGTPVGQPDQCLVPKPVINGVCGDADKTDLASKPTSDTDLCKSGDATAVITGAKTYNWKCIGGTSPKGKDALCSANIVSTENGKCGTADKTTTATKPSGTAALCAKGDPTAVSDGSDGTFAWTCNGTGTPKGTPANCSAKKPDNKPSCVNGWGPEYFYALTLPGIGLCASGEGGQEGGHAPSKTGGITQCISRIEHEKFVLSGTAESRFYVRDCNGTTSSCKASTETRTSTPCPSGQSGTITETRTKDVGNVCGSYSAWKVISNSCVSSSGNLFVECDDVPGDSCGNGHYYLIPPGSTGFAVCQAKIAAKGVRGSGVGGACAVVSGSAYTDGQAW